MTEQTCVFEDAPPSIGPEITVTFGYEDPSRNLLKNWNFEKPISSNDWIVSRAQAKRSKDAHTGKWSLHIHNRNHKFGQAYQRLTKLRSSTCYYYSCYIKLLTHPPDHTFFNVRAFLLVKFPHKDVLQKFNVAKLSFLKAPTAWTQFGGDFQTPNTPFEYAEIHTEIAHVEVDYLLDTASLIELIPDPDWREATDKEIQKHRTSLVNLELTLPNAIAPESVEIKITQKKRDFGIGAAISADAFNADTEQGRNYRECFFQHFDWAVFCNDTKWRPMEPRKGDIRFGRVDRSIKLLHEKGVTVRGHAIVWNKEDRNPDWVHGKKGEELQQEVDRRVDYLVNHFKDRIVQWDVCNEHLHNHWLEESTDTPDQLAHMFSRAHSIDPNCQLYLNDYLVVRKGDLTSAHANLAKDMLSRGVPVHGIGVQSHLRNLPLSPELFKKRLEIVGSAGLPIMATELSLHTPDVSQRAQSLEQALRILYANPQVQGAVFWHFSDLAGITMGSDMPLFEGPDFQPNEAGLRLEELLEKWRTNTVLIPTSREFKKSVRAYHGLYEVELFRDDKSVWGQSFNVQKGADLELKIDMTPEKGGCESCQQRVQVIPGLAGVHS